MIEWRGIMVKIAVCDDIDIVASLTERLLLQYNEALFDVDVFNKPQKLVEALGDECYDLFILDISMPGLSGIEVAEHIREKNYNAPIIFLTSYKEYMEEVFRVQTFDYIMKPITAKKLYPIIDKAIRFLDLDNEKFYYQFKKVDYSLLLKEIIYFEKSKRQVIIHTFFETETPKTINLSTNALLSKLDSNFVQTHTSFVINVKYVTEVRSDLVILALPGGKNCEIPISRKFKESARKQILKKIRDVM
jgi:DNA-binding LytR/AlgR family response regulator